MIKNELRKLYRKDLGKLYKFLKGTDNAKFITSSSDKIISLKSYGYIVLDNMVGNIPDLQDYLSKLRRSCSSESKIIITYYNHLWEIILKLGSFVGLRNKVGEQNWLDEKDIENLLNLAGFEIVTCRKRYLLPIDIPYLYSFINKWLAHLPIFNQFCLITFVVARLKPAKIVDYSVSIIVPARNEEENIAKIIPSIPRFGKFQEIIFIEGHSKDKTWQEINKVALKKYPKHIRVKYFKQNGVGKANAVHLGFTKANGDILMIYDADRTVDAKDLPKFYNALASGIGEFANGSRMVYPMEKDAMQTLNKIGNKIFGSLFTWILGQRFKDTLCGTKAMFRRDFIKYRRDYNKYLKTDPFGDFALIFTAIKHNLKVVEILVRYKERVYGSTNINRFYHGLLLVKMTLIAFKEFKF